jgi:ATP-dependent DNA ligase
LAEIIPEKVRRVLRLASLLDSAYMCAMLWRVHNSRGRLKNAPAAFIQPCRPTVSQRPPRGPGWAHELKHDGYRLRVDAQIKRSFSSKEPAVTAGAKIKKAYPVVVVTVVDTHEHTTEIINA